MLTFGQMFTRFAMALILGAILGIERELVGKEAGVRTEMLIAGGASLFAMIALSLPYVAGSLSGATPDLLAQAGAFPVIANVVVGIGFLGAGVIIKLNDRPHGITTAALVWVTAAIGVLAGLGMTALAVTAALFIAIALYILRKMNVSERLERRSEGGA